MSEQGKRKAWRQGRVVVGEGKERRQWTSSGWLRRCLGAVHDDAGQTYAAEPDDHIILVITHAIPVAASASAAYSTETGVIEAHTVSSSSSTHRQVLQVQSGESPEIAPK